MPGEQEFRLHSTVPRHEKVGKFTLCALDQSVRSCLRDRKASWGFMACYIQRSLHQCSVGNLPKPYAELGQTSSTVGDWWRRQSLWSIQQWINGKPFALINQCINITEYCTTTYLVIINQKNEWRTHTWLKTNVTDYCYWNIALFCQRSVTLTN